MPTVPQIELPSVAPATSTGTPYQTGSGATPDAFGAGIGQAQQGLGQAVEKFGDVIAKHADHLQDLSNQSAAKDMFLDADVKMGDLTTQYNALEGANRVNAYPQYVKDLQALREDQKRKAPNAEVARMFDNDFSRRLGFSIVDGARGAATANKAYNKATSAALSENTLQHIAANSADDERFKAELEIGSKNVEQQTRDVDGQSPEVVANAKQSFAAQAWNTRLTVMAKADPFRAKKLFEENKDSLDGLTQQKVDQTINQGIIQVGTRIDADKIAQDGIGVPEALVDKVKKLERYKAQPYADGRQTSSGYGTKAQPGDEKLSPEQLKDAHEQRVRSELGRAANIVDNFAPNLPSGTREALISLTYNTGSAWTSAGLGANIRSGNFEAAQANFKAYDMAGGKTLSSLTDRRKEELTWWGGAVEDHGANSDTRLAKSFEKAAEMAQQRFPNDPGNRATYEDTLRTRISSDFSTSQRAVKEANQALKIDVNSEVLDPAKRITAPEQMSPKAQQAYSQMSATDQAAARRQMETNAKADVPLTPERRNREVQIYGIASTKPDEFMDLDLTKEDLTSVQRAGLSKMQFDRKKLLDASAGTTKLIASPSVSAQLNDAHIYMSKTDPRANQDYEKFAGAFVTTKAAMEEELKRPITEKEAGELTAKLLRTQIMAKGTFLDTKMPTYEAIKEGKAIPVSTPEEARALPPGTKYRTPTGDEFVTNGAPRFMSGSAGSDNSEELGTPGNTRFSDFRKSDNIDDRRANSGSIKERVRELFFGAEATHGALTQKEFTQRMLRYSEDEISRLWREGGPSKMAKELGFDYVDRDKK